MSTMEIAKAICDGLTNIETQEKFPDCFSTDISIIRLLVEGYTNEEIARKLFPGIVYKEGLQVLRKSLQRGGFPCVK